MQVGFVGVGAMGAAMAGHVTKAGHDVIAWDLDAAALAAATDGAVSAARGLADLANRVEVAVIMAARDEQTRSIVAGLLDGGLAVGATIVVAATNDPRTMIDLGARCAKQGIGFVDAPVVYGLRGAQEGDLVSLCGGTAEDIARVLPVLSCYSRSVEHLGPCGAGQIGKTCNNMMHWALCVANYETLALARACGLDAGEMRQTLLKCPARNGTLERWDTTRLTWHEKDMDVVLTLAQDAGLPLPLFGLVDQLVKRLGPADIRALLDGQPARYLGLDIPEGPFPVVSAKA